MQTSLPRFATLVAALVVAAAAPSCVLVDAFGWVKVPESNDWNLSQLHKPSGSYNYTADLATDLQFLVRSGAGALPLKTKEERRLGNRKKIVRNPAEKTLENVLELDAFDPDREYVAGLQAMWFCRLALDDPSALVRARCVRALGGLGARLDIGTPVPLPPGAQPSGPSELADPLTKLIREFRLQREFAPLSRAHRLRGLLRGPRDDAARSQEAAAQAEKLDAACRELEALTLDVAGGRRVLYTANQLLRQLPREDPARVSLERLSRHVQRTSIEQALAGALGDAMPLVRASAVAACVRATGTEVLGPILLQLDREPSDQVAVRVVELVHEFGLPDAPDGMDPLDYAAMREAWLSMLYALAVNHPEGHVRVHAMRALAAVAQPGIDSLREEDWVDWWLARELQAAALGSEGRGT